jgi:hypothetical protein
LKVLVIFLFFSSQVSSPLLLLFHLALYFSFSSMFSVITLFSNSLFTQTLKKDDMHDDLGRFFFEKERLLQLRLLSV